MLVTLMTILVKVFHHEFSRLVRILICFVGHVIPLLEKNSDASVRVVANWFGLVWEMHQRGL